MRVVDDNHATLNFASDRLPRTAAGKVDAKIVFVNGARVTDIKPVGTHGNDIKYSARVSSQRPLKLHQKYTVKFRLGDAKTVSRFVKLFAVGEHGYDLDVLEASSASAGGASRRKQPHRGKGVPSPARVPGAQRLKQSPATGRAATLSAIG